MHTALMVVLLVISVILILSILLQSSKSDGLSGSIAGGAEQLFGKKKSNGYDAILARITTVVYRCCISHRSNFQLVFI